MGFDVTMVDPTYTGPSKSFSVLPKGAYRMEIVAHDERNTKKGDGKFVELHLSVVEPAEFEGTTFFEIVNTENPSVAAVTIGKRTLSAIANAVGILQGEYDDLHHKSFVAEVSVEKGTIEYPNDKNRLGRVYWEEGSAPDKLGPSGPPAASTAAAAPRPTVVPITQAKPAAAAARPWGKR